jgi:hypothetical protein
MIPVPRAVVTVPTLDKAAVHRKQPPGESTLECPTVFYSLPDGREFHRSKYIPQGTVDD